jgi:hypothetical protein
MEQQERILIELLGEGEMDGGGVFAWIGNIGASADRGELTDGRGKELQTTDLEGTLDVIRHLSRKHLGGKLSL